MEKWSEENWAAGWLMGLEFILWRGVEKGNFPALAWLAEQAGGWWTFEEFVPLDEWREKFRVAEAAHA